MFTFTKTNRPLATLSCNKFKDKIIYLDREDEIDPNDIDTDSLWKIIRDAVDEVKKYKHITKKEEEVLMRAVFEKDPPRGRLIDHYQEILQVVKREQGKDLYGPDAEFVPLFLPEKGEKQMNVVRISGMSGSGKSYFTNMCLQEIIKYFPSCNIYIFSRKEHDEDLEKGLKRNITRITCDESILESNLTVEDLAGSENNPSFLVYDDYERIANPDVKKFVEKLLFAGLEIGRSLNQHYFVITHELKTGLKTRVISSEMTHLVCFPSATPRTQITDVLEKTMGLSPSQTKNVLKLPSRWACVSKKYPQYVVYQKGMYIL
jgi:hypothetical protein